MVILGTFPRESQSDMTGKTRITSEVDFEKDGKQQGFLRLPHSVHRSAYGWIPIPIVVIKNGSGPNVLLTAANHGDEYEGQITLIKLCQELEPSMVRGRILMLTAMNFPAAIAGRRTSPIDEGNLNRSFPGDPDGTPTPAIAHYIESELLPLSDFAVDLHSGGSSLMYVPSSLMARVDNAEIAARQWELLKAFAAPIAYVAGNLRENRTMLAAARRANVAAIGTELGGTGGTSPHSMAIAERGVRRVLKIMGSVPDMEVGEEPPPTRMTEVNGPDYYVYSPDYGIWEPLVELGDEVEAGQPAATIYCLQTPWRQPVTTQFNVGGTVICKRVPGAVERGDCLFHVVTDYQH